MPAYDGRHEDAIRPFVDAMRYKLAANAKKGKWEGYTLETALGLLKAEVQELEEAIARGNTMEITMEGADIGNFAMMVVNIAIKAALGGQGSANFENARKPTTFLEDVGHEDDGSEPGMYHGLMRTFDRLSIGGETVGDLVKQQEAKEAAMHQKIHNLEAEIEGLRVSAAIADSLITIHRAAWEDEATQLERVSLSIDYAENKRRLELMASAARRRAS